MILNIIYLIAAAGFGLFIGLTLTAFADDSNIRALRHENEVLRLKLEEEKAKSTEHVEVIEITDTRADAPVKPDYFSPF